MAILRGVPDYEGSCRRQQRCRRAVGREDVHVLSGPAEADEGREEGSCLFRTSLSGPGVAIAFAVAVASGRTNRSPRNLPPPGCTQTCVFIGRRNRVGPDLPGARDAGAVHQDDVGRGVADEDEQLVPRSRIAAFMKGVGEAHGDMVFKTEQEPAIMAIMEEVGRPGADASWSTARSAAAAATGYPSALSTGSSSRRGW